LAGYKRCPGCGEILPIENFSRDSHKKDGLHSTCRRCRADYTKANKDCIKEYYEANKEYVRAQQKEYYLNNKSLFIAYRAKRRAAKLQATPKWANLVTIKEIYQTCPSGYHVDHIVPLQNEIVCGLHCEFNLQHLPASENLSKGNRFEIC
jgi:hypothetical protein